LHQPLGAQKLVLGLLLDTAERSRVVAYCENQNTAKNSCHHDEETAAEKGHQGKPTTERETGSPEHLYQVNKNSLS